MSIAFIDLKSQHQLLDGSVLKSISAVLEHGRYCMGPEVVELEKRLAAHCQVAHVLSCSSGTDALFMSLLAYGVGPGDAIFTTAFTFFATAEVIALAGATPVFVDIDPHSFNLDPVRLDEAIQNVKSDGKLKPKGIIPVDLFGLPADYDAIMDLAQTEDLFVLEDAAQSMGGSYKGRPAGSLGHVAATSFYPSKPLGCYGDGGAVFTDNQGLNDIMSSIRIHGQGDDKYHNVRLGLNARLDSIQAAVLLAKLPLLEQELEARTRVALRYNQGLRGVQTPFVPSGYRSAWALYSVLCDRRDELHDHLAALQIPSVIYYSVSLHLQDAFASLNYQRGDLPHSEFCSDRVISLPMHPFLSDEEVDQVIQAVNCFN